MSFPHYRQLDSMDCGPTCLKMVSRYYGKSVDLHTLREKCYITKRGVSLLGISDAAENIGFRTLGVKLTWEQLKDDANLPCIVHWNQNHFVVVHKIKEKRRRIFRRRLTSQGESSNTQISVSDPGQGLHEYNEKQFKDSWISATKSGEGRGIALLLEPTPKFYEEEDQGKKTSFLNLFAYLRPYKPQLIQLIFSMLTASIIGILFPFLTQSIVDSGIGQSDVSFISLVLGGQLLLSLGQLANESIRSWIMLHVTARVSITIISDYLTKLMRLPMSFFDSRLTGDIMQRISDHDRIQNFLTSSAVSIVFSVLTFLIYSATVAFYQLKVFWIFLAGTTLYVIWVMFFMKYRKEIDYKNFQHASMNQSSVLNMILGMQEIKLNNCEKQKRWEWETIQARLFRTNVKGLVLKQNQQIGAVFIDQSKNIFMAFITAQAVITGEMTLGMMMAIQFIIGQLNAPVQQFIAFAQSAQDARISFERLQEVQNIPNEEDADEKKLSEIPTDKDLMIDGLHFKFPGPGSEEVLRDVSFTIPANKVTAIVGASGSGKTTLIKLLLGFYKPTSGTIRLGNTPLLQYRFGEWRKKCGVVLQDGHIFSDSILKNIAVDGEKVDYEKLETAVDIACLKDFVELIPMGYNAKVGGDGQGMSSGQKQRLLIARAVYKDPYYFFFDEATNALDASNEKALLRKLGKFVLGRTVVFVAHRLSTVRNADQIIVLQDGQVKEIGKHDVLVNAKGHYFNLIKDQLELGG
jgi:ATP-binding cassette, subfamily B, bacterial